MPPLTSPAQLVIVGAKTCPALHAFRPTRPSSSTTFRVLGELLSPVMRITAAVVLFAMVGRGGYSHPVWCRFGQQLGLRAASPSRRSQSELLGLLGFSDRQVRAGKCCAICQPIPTTQRCLGRNPSQWQNHVLGTCMAVNEIAARVERPWSATAEFLGWTRCTTRTEQHFV